MCCLWIGHWGITVVGWRCNEPTARVREYSKMVLKIWELQAVTEGAAFLLRKREGNVWLLRNEEISWWFSWGGYRSFFGCYWRGEISLRGKTTWEKKILRKITKEGNRVAGEKEAEENQLRKGKVRRRKKRKIWVRWIFFGGLQRRRETKGKEQRDGTARWQFVGFLGNF